VSVRRDTADQIRLAWPLAGFFVLFFIAPLIILILVSFHTDAGMKTYGADQWVKLLGDGFSWRVLADTLWLGVEVTALCLVMGFALAWAYVRCPRGVQTLLIIVIVLPLLTSVVVRTFAWIVMLGRQGIINSLLQSLGIIDSPARLLYSTGGLVVALANVQLPLMVLPLITALQKLDPNLLDASEALGAGAWRTFRRVTLPLALARHRRRLPADLCRLHHRVHHPVAGGWWADAVHADVHLSAGLVAAELSVRRGDFHPVPDRGAALRIAVQHAGPPVARLRADLRSEVSQCPHSARNSRPSASMQRCGRWRSSRSSC
jgi:ABC-type spermidine/putrescine transport system permease subunit I